MNKSLLLAVALGFAVQHTYAGFGTTAAGSFPAVGHLVQHTVTGVVSDASGPLAGVTITVLGTTSSVQTDAAGQYRILAPVGSTLRLTAIRWVLPMRFIMR